MLEVTFDLILTEGRLIFLRCYRNTISTWLPNMMYVKHVLHVSISVWTSGIITLCSASHHVSTKEKVSKELYEPDPHRDEEQNFICIKGLCLHHPHDKFWSFHHILWCAYHLICTSVTFGLVITLKERSGRVKSTVFSSCSLFIYFEVKWEMCNGIKANGHIIFSFLGLAAC